jgi:hypothetical protein
MRQFTPWAQGAGGFLAHHGIIGFLANLDQVRGMDEEDRKWAVFLAAWLEKFGTRSVRPTEILASAELGMDHPGSGWNGDFITDKNGRYPRLPTILGQWLAGQADRWHGDPPLTLRADHDGHNKANLYCVERWQG